MKSGEVMNIRDEKVLQNIAISYIAKTYYT